MPTLGVDNFAGGITKRNRVSVGETAMLARCSGYDFRDGRLLPENVPSDLTTGTALTGTTAEQVPFAFVQDAATKIIARDSTTAFREHASGVWGSAGDTLNIVEENVPARVRDLIVYSSDGANPRLMAYEPESTTDKLRPLSFKGPGDYEPGTKPAVVASATAAMQLFDMIVGTREWAWSGADYGTLTETADKIVIDLDSTTIASTLIAEKSLATVTKDPTGKAFLILDVMIQEDTEPLYNYPGLFANKETLMPSGYLIGLYDDTACTSLIASYRIPKCTQGAVNRIAINLGDISTTIQGVGLLTDSFFTVPTGTDTYSITFYSEAFEDDWSAKGNWLMPPVRWEKSPLAAKLAGLINVEAGEIDLPPVNNAMVDINPSFESAGDWTYAGWAERQTWYAKSGAYSCKMRNDTPSGSTLTSASFTVEAGREYAIGFWYMTPDIPRSHLYRVTITPTPAGDATYWPGAATWEGMLPSTTSQRWVRQWTAPTGATSATFKIESKGEWLAGETRMYVDDVFVYKRDQATQGSAAILQTFGEDGTTERIPDDPQVQWCYCFAGRDRLGTDNWSLMISNPSDPSSDSPFVYADPWRTYALTVTLPKGAINTVASAPTAAGTGYSVNDILLVSGGEGGKVKVATLVGADGTGVATLTLLKAGTGYATGTGQATVNETDTGGTGCTINITDTITPIEEYGDYLTHILIYRRVYDGEIKILSSWQYVQAVAIGASMTWTDEGTDAEPIFADRNIPQEVQITNDYLGSGRYSTYADRRVYAACLDWDNENSKWLRPTAIAVSGYEKSWAYPTTVDENSLLTDGTELDGYAQTGAEVRGLVTRNDEKFVFLDNEFFLLRGDNPLTGWQFIRIDSVGLKDARTLVDCRGMLIWHDGHDFYGYTGGRAEVISLFSIDASLINWSNALGATYFDGRYVMYCTYDSTNCLLAYDVASGAWKIRYSDTALTLVGICTDGDNLYGLTSGGNVFNLYGSSTTEATDSGTQTPTRAVWTGYVRISEPGADGQVSAAVLDVETAQASLDLTLTLNSHGKQNQTRSLTPTVDNNTMRYVEPVSIQGDAMQLRYSLASTTPPDIYFLGVDVDEVAAR